MDIACNLGHHELVIFLIGNGAFRDTTKKLQMKDNSIPSSLKKF